MRWKSSFAIGLLSVAACSSLPSIDARRNAAEVLAAKHNWQAVTIHSDRFDLRAYLPGKAGKGEVLSIYIEGDGLAWISSTQASSDPTPLTPLALQLALAQPDGQAAYLARPCQYETSPGVCRQAYWTNQRFAPEVVEAMDRAVDILKLRSGARRITLIGYSGGGAIAALLASRRKDVASLVTVAGNLDHRAWTEFHRVSPLDGSLNPVEFRTGLGQIPQWHFSGREDRIVPSFLLENFVEGMSNTRVRIIPEYDHYCCWARDWPRLWKETR